MLSRPRLSRGAAMVSLAVSAGLLAIAASGWELVGNGSLAHLRSSSAVNCIMFEMRLVVVLRYAPSAIMRLQGVARLPMRGTPLVIKQETVDLDIIKTSPSCRNVRLGN